MKKIPKYNFKMSAVLDISAVELLHEQLAELLAMEEPISMDASEVERLTTPCAQLLVSFFRTVKGPVTVERPSEAFCSAWADLGLNRIFPFSQEG